MSKQRAVVQKNQSLIIKAISQLAKEGENINPNRVSKITGITWKTVKKYFVNDFYLQGV